MGLWQWLREFVDLVTIFGAQPAHLLPERPVDLIAHVLQRAVEGGHWMLTPPTLLTLVHAVQQPIGRPAFAALNVEHTDITGEYYLQPDRSRGRTDPQELAPVTAWRRLHETSAFLMGALRIHGASTAKVDVRAEWIDPIDVPGEPAPARKPVRSPGRRAAPARVPARGIWSRPARRSAASATTIPRTTRSRWSVPATTPARPPRSRSTSRRRAQARTGRHEAPPSCVTPPSPRRATVSTSIRRPTSTSHGRATPCSSTSPPRNVPSHRASSTSCRRSDGSGRAIPT